MSENTENSVCFLLTFEWVSVVIRQLNETQA